MPIQLIAEDQLLKRGALDWLDPVTGVVALSPRTKEVLTLIAGALRSVATITQAEMRTMQTAFTNDYSLLQ